MDLNSSQYDAAEMWCKESVSRASDFLFNTPLFETTLQKKSEGLKIPIEALYSFFRNIHLIHVKRTTHNIRESLHDILAEYSKEGRSILNIAKDINYPPYLLARLMVEQILSASQQNKRAITEAMRDPLGRLGDVSAIAPQYLGSEKFKSVHNKQASQSKVSTTRLSLEVMEAIDHDPMYGPSHDRERKVVGEEFEILLEQTLRKMDVPFETETDLRERGTSRTPDILLTCPVGIQVPKRNGQGLEWKVVCWIDSKAMFGDVNTHQTSVLPQAESYVHRFGPGLVLYWFGHAPLERLDDGHGDVAISSWKVPEKMLLPTGETIWKHKKNIPLDFKNVN